ncbi:hypothetical protein PV326_007282, partial [Microctonus aethiopoides]
MKVPSTYTCGLGLLGTPQKKNAPLTLPQGGTTQEIHLETSIQFNVVVLIIEFQPAIPQATSLGDMNGQQCASKLGSLKKFCESYKDHNFKRGNDRRAWQHFQ